MVHHLDPLLPSSGGHIRGARASGRYPYGVNFSLKGYINARHDFMCGHTDTPPLPSGAIGEGHLKIAQRGHRKRNRIQNRTSPKQRTNDWDTPRDPNRISEVLAAIEARWREVPDQRLGQVLVNAVRRELSPEPENEANTLFAVEDGKLLEVLRKGTGTSSTTSTPG